MTCTAAVVLLERMEYTNDWQGRIAFGACIGRNLPKDHPNDKDKAPTVVVVMGGHVNQQGYMRPIPFCHGIYQNLQTSSGERRDAQEQRDVGEQRHWEDPI